MKRIIRHRTFTKNYKQRFIANEKLDKQFEERTNMFVLGVREEPINDHGLKGARNGERSFSISGDIRVIYRETDKYIELLDISSHNQVY